MFMKRRIKQNKGVALTEMVLVAIPFIALTLGSLEYLWFMHVQMGLTSAAELAVSFVATDHNSIAGSEPVGKALDSYQDGAEEIALAQLAAIGFTNAFLSSVTVEAAYLQNQGNSRFHNGGYPQKEGRRLVGVTITIPLSEAFIFGNIAAKILQASTNLPEQYSVTAFMWRQWKEEK